MDSKELDGLRTQVTVPLKDWVIEIIRETVKEAIVEHTKTCEALRLIPVVKETAKKVENIRLRLAFMTGAGLLGGGTVFALVKLLGA